jgi:hypothetical protein
VSTPTGPGQHSDSGASGGSSRVEPVFAEGTPPELASAYTVVGEAISLGRAPGAAPIAPVDALVGVGVGLAEDADSMELHIVATRAVPVEEVRAALADLSGRDLRDVPIRVVITGEFQSQQKHAVYLRPAPAGVSIGRIDQGAGSLGFLASGREEPLADSILLVSCNHVLTLGGIYQPGDRIYQLAWSDYGSGYGPAEQIATVHTVIPITYDSVTENLVDCASALVDLSTAPDLWQRVTPWVYDRGGKPEYWQLDTPIILHPSIKMIVGKSGRTTGMTQGEITEYPVRVFINMKFGSSVVKRVLFVDQFRVKPTSLYPEFAKPGDSGSCVFLWYSPLNPVGMLIGGSPTSAIVTPLMTVLNSLKLDMLMAYPLRIHLTPQHHPPIPTERRPRPVEPAPTRGDTPARPAP